MHNNFIMSQNFDIHPILKANRDLREKYFHTLKYIVEQCDDNNKYTAARLKQYMELFIDKNCKSDPSDNIDYIVKSVVNNFLKPWQRKNRYFLLCDFAFILVDKTKVKHTLELLRKFLSRRQYKYLNIFFEILFDENLQSTQITSANILLNQFRENQKFINQHKKRILVTANMSAGKSTLINAIIGKPITKTSQEACTANIYYIYNKPFEDKAMHILASEIDFNAKKSKLQEKIKSKKNYIASYFRTFVKTKHRICMIDTPGVNSILHPEHGILTRDNLLKEEYDILIYVFNGGKLGTDEEFRYLKYISETISKEKIVFIINKLDDYKSSDDSIELSINGVKNDLVKLGYENPIICPVSAYFAFLIKMVQNNEYLTEDEQDSFDLFTKKFNKPEYDLSRYYQQQDQAYDDKDKLLSLSKKCGIHGLESTLFRN